MKTDWNEIIESSNLKTLKEFGSGTVTRHEFRAICPAARRLVENVGVTYARRLARKAVRRRS